MPARGLVEQAEGKGKRRQRRPKEGIRRSAAGGAYALFDNGERTPLPHSLRPGDAAVLDCRVRAPHTAGRYRLEFDLQRNFVGWFTAAGAAPPAVDCELTWPRAPEGDVFDYHA